MSDDITKNTLNQIIDGLSKIMELSYRHCKDSNLSISMDSSNINNIAFELKRLTIFLQNEAQS
jgi:hypothetical protein